MPYYSPDWFSFSLVSGIELRISRLPGRRCVAEVLSTPLHHRSQTNIFLSQGSTYFDVTLPLSCTVITKILIVCNFLTVFGRGCQFLTLS